MSYYCGIDLGGTNIKAGIVDGEGKLLNKLSIKTNADRAMEDIIHDMGQLASDAIKDAGLEIKDIECIGIGSPGTPDNDEGLLVYSSNLPFNKAPMRKLIREVVDLPVYIDNDANCAAMAEAVAGAAKGAKDSVTITLGTGVGAGVIVNGRIFSVSQLLQQVTTTDSVLMRLRRQSSQSSSVMSCLQFLMLSRMTSLTRAQRRRS